MTLPWPKRFWSNVQKTKTCWLWKGCKFRLGYGAVRVPHKGMQSAHRIAWLLSGRKIPINKEIRHKCGIRSCVNPKHLTIGTHKQNMHDAVRQGTAGFHKLGPQQAQRIRKLYKSGKTLRTLAKMFKVHSTNIWHVVHNKTWKREIICTRFT